MIGSIDNDLASAAKHVEIVVAAIASRRVEDARCEFLLAAESLFEAASRSRGQLKETRTQLTEELVRRPEALVVTNPPVNTVQRNHWDGRNKPDVVPPDDAVRSEADWLVAERPQVRFDDVAGLEDVKEQVRLKLIYSFTHTDAARRLGI